MTTLPPPHPPWPWPCFFQLLPWPQPLPWPLPRQLSACAVEMLAAIKARPPTMAAVIVFDPFRRNMVLSTPCRGRILPCAGRDREKLARNRGSSPSIQRATVENPSWERGHFAVKKAQQIRSGAGRDWGKIVALHARPIG